MAKMFFFAISKLICVRLVGPLQTQFFPSSFSGVQSQENVLFFYSSNLHLGFKQIDKEV